MQVVLNVTKARQGEECAELCFTIRGEPTATMVLVLDPAGRDSQGLVGAVREQLCDLVDRIDDWIRKDGRIVVSRDESPCAARRRLSSPPWEDGGRETAG